MAGERQCASVRSLRELDTDNFHRCDSARAYSFRMDSGQSGCSVAALERTLLMLVAGLGVEDLVATAARRISSGDEATLHEIERGQLKRASDARRREFASGRALLRMLIGDDVAIPIGADRRPVLPAAVRASLAHDRAFVVAAMSKSARIERLGIDLETVQRLAPADAALIVRPDEGDLDPTLAFVLKEAAFKAWSGAGGRMLDHHDVRVRVTDGFFDATILKSMELTGAWASVGDRFVALASQPSLIR